MSFLQCVSFCSLCLFFPRLGSDCSSGASYQYFMALTSLFHPLELLQGEHPGMRRHRCLRRMRELMWTALDRASLGVARAEENLEMR